MTKISVAAALMRRLKIKFGEHIVIGCEIHGFTNGTEEVEWRLSITAMEIFASFKSFTDLAEYANQLLGTDLPYIEVKPLMYSDFERSYDTE